MFQDEKVLLCKEECYKIVGACMAVHRELGHGFLESVYQEALAIELQRIGIPFEREKDISIIYKGVALKKAYKADFICYDQIIIELKALSGLTNDHVAQLLNYLKATKLRVGLLINFGTQSLEHQKYVL
ncbi:MAG: GxxExxY protein [Candidatus Cloacimonetes bacterium]|nr:GxxExxY protein [Candidatus Cloacimonadota bacterium]